VAIRSTTRTVMTNAEDESDERPMEAAMHQFRLLRRQERLNVLNQTKVRRRAREAGLSELADVVEDRRYYELADRYRAENGFDDASDEG
jgi:hypothetical protein